MKTRVFVPILILLNLQIFAQQLTQEIEKSRKERLIESPLTPSKAAFYSAVLPGLGQIYIGKAWKVPFVYAAIGASVYGYVSQEKIEERFEQINNFEKHLEQNGTKILKIYLHISKEEQLQRLNERISIPEKNWKTYFYEIINLKKPHFDIYIYTIMITIIIQQTEILVKVK